MRSNEWKEENMKLCLEIKGWKALGSCLSVEIKPKCGFLPSAKTIHPGRNIKKKVSRFRLQQSLKLNLVNKDCAYG